MCSVKFLTGSCYRQFHHRQTGIFLIMLSLIVIDACLIAVLLDCCCVDCVNMSMHLFLNVSVNKTRRPVLLCLFVSYFWLMSHPVPCWGCLFFASLIVKDELVNCTYWLIVNIRLVWYSVPFCIYVYWSLTFDWFDYWKWVRPDFL